MRLFAAIVPPPRAVEQLAHAIAAVRREHPDVPVRWAPPERWHLTLAFYGEVGEQAAPELAERLGRAAGRRPPMRLSFTGAGRFGDRVLWIGLQGDTDELTLLAASSTGAGRRCGLSMEDRAYRPHLTVARSGGRGARPDLESLVAALRGYAGEPWDADRLVLVRSHLGPQPRYDEHAAWVLGGGAATGSAGPVA
jgi:2'-5' RNA ligase